MKRTLLFVLALAVIPVGVDAQGTPSASCADINGLSPLEDVRSCAEQGDARVQFMLGMAYRIGDESEFGIVGIPQDDAEAVRWWRLAAEQGHEFAQQGLGQMYADGEGVQKDHVLAYMWWNLAAAQGNVPSRSRRDLIERQMTREQIAEAQRLSREWKEAHPGGN